MTRSSITRRRAVGLAAGTVATLAAGERWVFAVEGGDVVKAPATSDTPWRPVLFSERGGGLSPATVRLWFHRPYTSLKMEGCSSHSGRRTFIRPYRE